MILIFCLLVCPALVPPTLARSPADLHGDPLSSPRQRVSNTSCTRDYSCLDCTTVQVCAPTPDGTDLYEIARFQCDSSYPYCNYNSGTCSYQMDPHCYDPPNNTVSNNFTCMRDGYFPDPYNCSMYYHCRDEKPYVYGCLPPYPYYSPYYRECVSYNYDCANLTTPNCNNSYSAGQKILLSTTSNMFLYCGLNDTVITVDKCIGAYIFDGNTQTCQQYCPHEGLFPRDDDCANYYKCTPDSQKLFTNFIITNLTCPEGQAFSETDYACVDRSLVPNCQVPYPAMFSK